MMPGALARWRKPVLLLAAFLLLCLAARGLLFRHSLTSTLQLSEPYVLDVAPGSSLRRVLRNLEGEGILPRAGDLLFYARFTDHATRMQAGEYLLTPDLDGRALLDLLASGKVIFHEVRLVEGWTLQQALRQIQSHPAVKVELDPEDTERLAMEFGEGRYPEGLFFPDTYFFTRGTSDTQLLRRARWLMDEVVDTLWPARDSGLPFDTPYEALILASIIEKETGLAEERGQIAGVFVRRLQQNMRLQTDPTVIYGLGNDFDGNLTRSHLQTDTPWNTYTRHGLPPTPIALPGLAAIEAALHPEPGNTLYFVARGDGSHQFSATLEEHNQAVRRYQLRQEVQ